MLRSDLCDFSDAYIVVKGTIVTNPDNAKRNKLTTQKITMQDITMPMYYLLKQSKN